MLIGVTLDVQLINLAEHVAVADHLQKWSVDVAITSLEFAKQLFVDFIRFFVLSVEEVEVGKLAHFDLLSRVFVLLDCYAVEGSKYFIGYFGGLFELSSQVLNSQIYVVSHFVLKIFGGFHNFLEGLPVDDPDYFSLFLWYFVCIAISSVISPNL